MASGASLELVWSVAAVVSALIGITGTHPIVMASVAAIAMAFALLAHCGELAAKRPRRGELVEGALTGDEVASREAIGFNLVAAVVTLGLGTLAIVGVESHMVATFALLLLAGVLVLDAPLEKLLAAPRGGMAGAYMVLAGIAGIVLVSAALSTGGGDPHLVPWAALVVATGHLVGSFAVLWRYARTVTKRTR